MPGLKNHSAMPPKRNVMSCNYSISPSSGFSKSNNLGLYSILRSFKCCCSPGSQL